jgi:hypothetical protein
MDYVQEIILRASEHETQVFIFVSDELQEHIISTARRIRTRFNSVSCPCLNAKLVDTAEDCAICLGGEEGSGAKLPCGHIFHYDCLSKWVAKQATCPLCRAPVDTG